MGLIGLVVLVALLDGVSVALARGEAVSALSVEPPERTMTPEWTGSLRR